MNACLNFMSDMRHGYVEGYLRAADRLVQHVADTGTDQDLFVYPIAFMYRQHIELQLKTIIDSGGHLLDERSGHPTHHRVNDLWPLAKCILRRVWAGDSDPHELALIDDFVHQWSVVDHDSTAFRYPTTRVGRPGLAGIDHINLRHLRDCVHSFSTFLDGATHAIAEYLDWKRQIELNAARDWAGVGKATDAADSR